MCLCVLLKDKRCDELAKQVIRFKRIQEIVLSAQTSVNPHANHGNGKNRGKYFFQPYENPYLKAKPYGRGKHQ